jgi:signal transduction histidine kinase
MTEANEQLEAPRGLTMRFPDPALERIFVEGEFAATERLIRSCLVFSFCLIVGFWFLDPVFVPPDVLGAYRAARLGLAAPIPVVGYIVLLTVRNTDLRIAVICILVTTIGLLWSGSILLGGPTVASYTFPSVTMTVLFTYMLLGLPFRAALISVVITTVAYLAALSSVDTSTPELLNASASILASVSIATLGAYRLEWASRRRFLAERRNASEYQARLAAQNERAHWLQAIANFLRHELKNAIASVTTSLELIRRTGEEQRATYLSRATQAIEYMKRMLNQVAQASTLEAALKQHALTELSLSELLADWATDVQLANEGRRIDVRIAADIRVRGHADSLVQMLDKIMNNALEHALPDTAVECELRRVGENAVVSISNEGETLPAEPEALFAAFASYRARPREDNLGLGLYVARVIGVHHGGTVVAASRAAPSGATFEVRLPLVEDAAASAAASGMRVTG